METTAYSHCENVRAYGIVRKNSLDLIQREHADGNVLLLAERNGGQVGGA